MTRDRFGGDPRRRARRRGLVGPTVALVGVAAGCLLLALVTAGQVVASACQTGRPGIDAAVIACSPSGGDGARCQVRVSRDGHDLVLPLADAALMFPEPGDRLPVVIGDDGTASPAGWRPWVASGVLAALLGASAGGVRFWWRRLVRARTAGAAAPLPSGGHDQGVRRDRGAA